MRACMCFFFFLFTGWNQYSPHIFLPFSLHTPTLTHTNLNPLVTVQLSSPLTGRDSYSAHEWNKFPVKHTVTKVIVFNQPLFLWLGPVGMRPTDRCRLRYSSPVCTEGVCKEDLLVSGTHKKQFAAPQCFSSVAPAAAPFKLIRNFTATAITS